MIKESVNKIQKLIDKSVMKKIRIVKLEELKEAETPNNKEEGYYKEGLFGEDPKVGEEFLLYMEFAEFGGNPKGRIPIWHTSTVMEILSSDTFKTKNSIYKIIPLTD